ncbi:MAG: hypothetical protein ACOX9C_09625 [Kiritimatiellia bacterium]
MLLNEKGRILTAVFAVAIMAAARLSVAQDFRNDPAFQMEMDYIAALTEARMIDYAALVTEDLARKHPGAKVILKTIKLNQTLQLGRFDEAMAMIAKEPDQESPEVWAMKLTVADYHYARGKYKEALSTYNTFFEKYKSAPPPSIATFYKESYYKFAQMLLFLDQTEKALAAYEGLLAIKDLDVNTRRQASFEVAELMVKQAADMKAGKERDELLKKAQRHAEDLMWDPDLWFGRSLALIAHIHVIKGDIDRAGKLLGDYMKQLKNIDKQLADQSEETGEDLSGLSPIAECRFLMGLMMQEEAMKLLDGDAPDAKKAGELLVEALKHFVNVYVRFPSTSWAPDAMIRSEEVQMALKERLDVRDIQMDITPEQRKTIAEKQFANARKLFNQQQLEAAADAYEIVLSQFPDAIPESINAVSEFARTYIQMGDNEQATAEQKQACALFAETITGHLAERFSKATKEGMTLAGDELRRIADAYGERGLNTMRDAAMALFFKHFTEHPLAAPLIMAEAEKLYKDNDFAGAAPYYQQLMDDYERAPLSYSAMMRLADCHAKLGDFEKELAVRKTYVERVEKRDKPGNDLVVGRYLLVRLQRNEAIRKLRAATEAFEAARKGEAPAADDADAAAVGGAESADAPAVDPVDEAMKAVGAANNELALAANEYQKIIALLSGADRVKYEANEKEKKTNESILQGCLFDWAYTLAAITQPADKVAQYKMLAIKAYEDILAKFPESEGAPAVLLQIGTLWSTIKTDDPAQRDENIKKADAAFSRLSQEFPESEQAKNALFLRGRALIELGYRAEGVEVFKKMFVDASKFPASQLMLAAQELLASKEHALARQGFELALASSGNDPAIVIPCEMGLADLLVAEKRYVEAVDALEKFIAANPTSYKILEANELMAKAAALATEAEPDKDKRTALYVRALASIRKLAQYQTTPKDQADQMLKIGDVLETRVEVERKIGDKALVDRYLGEAQAHYQQFAMTADPQDAQIQPALERAFRQSIKLLLEMKTYRDGTPVYEDVKNDCERYLQLFPAGRYVADVRGFLTEAEVSISVKR